MLFTLTVRKAADVLLAEQRLKRGGGAVQSLAGDIADPAPDSAEAAMIAESVERLLGRLSEELRSIAIAKMEGYTNTEVGARIGRTEVTVERKPRLIRTLWQDSVG